MFYVFTKILENYETDSILEGESYYLKYIDCSFEEGISISSEDILSPVKFNVQKHCTRGVMVDHLWMPDIPGPVFSQKAKDLFDSIGITDIEYFKLLIRDEFPEGTTDEPRRENEEKKVIEYTDYYIANVVGLVDCVDHEKSELEYFYPPELRNPDPDTPPPPDDIEDPFAGENPDDIDFITKLVLDESKIDPELKVFRLKDQPDLLVFHESVVDLIRKENLSGFVFVPVDKYTDVIPDDDEEEKEENEKNGELKDGKAKKEAVATA